MTIDMQIRTPRLRERTSTHMNIIISWPTAAVVIASLAALAGLAAYHVDAMVIAAVAGGCVTVAGALAQLATKKENSQ